MSNMSTSLEACSLKFSARASSSALSLAPFIASPIIQKKHQNDFDIKVKKFSLFHVLLYVRILCTKQCVCTVNPV